MTAASVQGFSSRVKGLPPLTIKDVKVITLLAEDGTTAGFSSK
jgi:hypothetical protein